MIRNHVFRLTFTMASEGNISPVGTRGHQCNAIHVSLTISRPGILIITTRAPMIGMVNNAITNQTTNNNDYPFCEVNCLVLTDASFIQLVY